MSVGTGERLLPRVRLRIERPRLAAVQAELWLLAVLVLAGGLLRFLTLGEQSYWFDEAQAAHEFRLSFGAMVSSMLARESNPPLYFVLAWLWAKVFGTGAVGLRALSALAGTALIPLVYLCGRALVSERAGLAAAALTALNPFMIWYSQEAREYMLLAAMCGASLLYFSRSLDRPSARNLAMWAVFSALAVLTHTFAGFLIAPEAIALLYVARNRVSLLAVAGVAIVQVALLPLVLEHASNTLLSFIHSVPLQTRIQQVPVAFGFGPLYQSPIESYGLLGAAVLVAALILLVVTGTTPAGLRGTGIAAGLAAVVLIAPLLLALAGTDYYIARALMPAWIPLAIVVGAACAAPAARLPGAALLLVLLGAFIYAQVTIDNDPQYQRPDWRGVAAALGKSGSARAIVVDDPLGTDPLKLYLARVPWTNPPRNVTVTEVDVVGSPWQVRIDPLPAGTRMIGRRVVDGFLVDRFAVDPAWRLPPSLIAARGARLLSPTAPQADVLLQGET